MDVFSILKREKESKKIQKLPETFYSDIAKFISRRKELIEKIGEETEEVKRLKYELENVLTSVEELYDKREKKIILGALLSAKEKIEMLDKELLTMEERILFDILYRILKGFREKVIEKVISGEEPDLSGISKEIEMIVKSLKVFTERNVKVLRIIVDTSEFVGVDLKTYGPFKMEDIVIVGKDVAKMLKETGHAEELEVKI